MSAKPFVVAHRGASADAPENTLESMKLAWEQGADAVECDVRRTEGGQIVCHHDPLPPDWRESGTVPSLADVLVTVPATGRIFVEIKDDAEVVSAVLEVIRQSCLAIGQVTIISFTDEVIARSKQEAPEYSAFLITSFKQDVSGLWGPTAEELVVRLRACGADAIDARAKDCLDAQFVLSMRDAGYAVHAWTVNEPEKAEYFASMGVQSITTDKPGLVRRVLGK